MCIARAHKFYKNEDGVAAIEFALLFPILLFILLGIWDLGNGVLAQQKVISSAQIVADLVGRETNINSGRMDQAFEAGRVAMMPFPTEGKFKAEVLSVLFNGDGDAIESSWHETSDGSGGDIATMEAAALTLAEPNEGAVVVQVTYEYDPYFSDFITGRLIMRERAFARGRQTPYVRSTFTN